MCQNHGFNDLTQINIFRNGILHKPKLVLNATVSGSKILKSAKDVVEIIENETQ